MKKIVVAGHEVNLYFTGKLPSGDDVRVYGEGKLAFVDRNQGDHDSKYFLLKLLPVDEAIRFAKRICSKQSKGCAIGQTGEQKKGAFQNDRYRYREKN